MLANLKLAVHKIRTCPKAHRLLDTHGHVKSTEHFRESKEYFINTHIHNNLSVWLRLLSHDIPYS